MPPRRQQHGQGHLALGMGHRARQLLGFAVLLHLEVGGTKTATNAGKATGLFDLHHLLDFFFFFLGQLGLARVATRATEACRGKGVGSRTFDKPSAWGMRNEHMVMTRSRTA